MELEATHTRIAGELLRALRGRRSQSAFSRRLGYRSNIAYRWESEQCWPSATKFLWICRRSGIDLHASFSHFYGRRPAWLSTDPASPATVVGFLRDLRGKIPIKALAEAAGVNRFTLSRWLKGSAQPRLPELLTLIEVTSRRLLDFIEGLIDPRRLPSLAQPHRELQLARELAYDQPWSHAVLRALELPRESGNELERLTRTLGADKHTIHEALERLEQTGQVRRKRGRRVLHRVIDVNTGRDPARARTLKQTWISVALARLAAAHPGLYGYSLFAVSRADLRRLRDVQLEYVRQMDAIIAASSSPECVGLYAVQLLDLGRERENALRQVAGDLPK